MGGRTVSTLRFISAGAGSGKTYTLTNILGDELQNGRVKPGGVIATTFTVKAATELRERVRQHLLGHGLFDLANAMGQGASFTRACRSESWPKKTLCSARNR